MILNGLLNEYMFLCLRIVLTLSRIKSTLILIKCNIKGMSFMLRPVNVLLGTRTFRVLQVMKVIVGNNRNTRLIRSFSRRAFNVRVYRSRQTLCVYRSPFFSPFFRNTGRNVKSFHVVSRICPTRTSFLFIPNLIYLIISSNDCASCSFAFPVDRRVINFAGFRYDIFLLIRNIRRIVRGIKSKVEIIFM